MFAEYSWDIAYANFLSSLKVMGLGMLSIFAVIVIIYGAVSLLSAISKE